MLYSLQLLGVIVCSIIIRKHAVALSTPRTFLGREIDDSQWETKKTLIDCFSTNASWKLRANRKEVLWTHEQRIHDESHYWKHRTCPENFQYGDIYDWYSGQQCGQQKQYLNLQRTCEVMNGRDILFLGDSITNYFAFEFLMALKDLANDSPHEYNQTLYLHRKNHYHMRQKVSCTSANRPDFYVENFRTNQVTLDIIRRNQKYLPLNPRKALIILNRGAHYATDGNLSTDLSNIFTFFQESYPQAVIIYRSTYPGTLDYEKKISQDGVFSEIDNENFSGTAVLNEEWHYEDFMRQHKMVQTLIAEKFHQSVLFMNVYKMFSLRRDGHCDMLHFCVPGPEKTGGVSLLYQIIDLFGPPTSLPVESFKYHEVI